MYIIRPIEEKDYPSLKELAYRVSMGLLNLPKNPAKLNKLLELSLASFAKEVEEPEDETYLFVLENCHTNEIGGTCGIFSKTGVSEPTFYYKILTETAHSDKIPLVEQLKLLKPVSYRNGPTEVGALYLLSEWRAFGLGRLLSLSRFLFIASHLERFDEAIISNLRGPFDRHGYSPFWESLGRYFIDLDFPEVLTHLETDKSFIKDAIPKYPVYISLLSEEAKQAIGMTHRYTKGALSLLTKEGFTFSDEIDVFDGGPKLSCKKEDLRVVKESACFKIKEIHKTLPEEEAYLISNNSLNFRCCLGAVQQDHNGVIITEEVANALAVAVGETVRICRAIAVKE